MAKSKKKPIAIIFSDLHLNDWPKFNINNERTLNGFRVLFYIRDICIKYSIPCICCGDLLHKSEHISQEFFDILQQKFHELEQDDRFRCLSISGNHDIYKVSKIQERPVSWVHIFSKYYSWLVDIDYHIKNLNDSYMIYGVPYVDHNIGLSEYLKNLKLDPKYKNILLLHTDYPGAKDTDGRVIDSCENLNLNILNRFDLILCGHIHKPQRLSKKVYMIGAPNQQRRTDRNCDMGYWELYPDLTMKFVHLKDFPIFIDVESEKDIKDDGNYYTVMHNIAKSSKIAENTHKITKKLSKRRLAKLYLKEKSIKDDSKEKLLIDILKKTES